MSRDTLSLKKWEDADSFTRLLTLNRRFLEGRIPMAPYHHFAPLMEETKELIPGLVRLHELRIFTWKSQPYDWRVREDDRVRARVRSEENWHRPYICFVMADEDEPLRIFKKLKARKDIKVYATTPPQFEPVDFNKENLVIRRHREAGLMKELKAKSLCTSSLRPVTKHLHERFEKWFPNAWAKSNPWYFAVVGTSWKRDTDVAEIIAKAASQE